MARSVSSPSTCTALSLVSKRVVEGEFVFGEAELLATGVCLAHVPRQPDQLLDYLRRLDCPVLVAAEGVLQHVGEGAGLHYVLASTRGEARP